jgi:hypothetical protein
MTKLRSVLALTVLVSAGAANAGDFRYNYTLVSSEVPPNWTQADPAYGNWVDVGNIYGCSNWSPYTSTVGKGLTFEQIATNCSQNQTRTVQPQIKNNVTGEIKAEGAMGSEDRAIIVSDHRDAIGTLENWLGFDPTFTSWVDTNALYGCSAWSPDPAIYNQNKDFVQTSLTCKTDQERFRQEREQEKFTQEIRNDGLPIKENQTLSGQSADRAYSITFGAWADSGALYGCSNWSPDPATQNLGLTFTQTATDCSVNQRRDRFEAYIDHKTKATVNLVSTTATQVVTRSSTRSATGTKETWAATTSVYSAWANSSGLYSCGAYSPDPSAYTAATQFNQTAYCYVNQSRTRQDRQVEVNSGAIRNVGGPVAEGQTIGGQPSVRTYLQDYSAWGWGAFYSCGAWSPDPSTVSNGSAFTQTQYCYRNLTRGAAGYIYNGGWVADPANPYRVETQVYSGQPNYQTAYGTKNPCGTRCQGGGG